MEGLLRMSMKERGRLKELSRVERGELRLVDAAAILELSLSAVSAGVGEVQDGWCGGADSSRSGKAVEPRGGGRVSATGSKAIRGAVRRFRADTGSREAGCGRADGGSRDLKAVVDRGGKVEAEEKTLKSSELAGAEASFWGDGADGRIYSRLV